MVCIHCPLCCMRHFPTLNDLKKHLIHYLVGDLKCPFCDHYAAGLENLMLHLDLHDDSVKNEILNADNNSGNGNHMDIIEFEVTNSVIKDESGKQIEELAKNEMVYDGENHVNNEVVYDGENQDSYTRYTCGMCEIQFATIDILRDHAVEIHAVSSFLTINGCASNKCNIPHQEAEDVKEEEQVVQCGQEEEIKNETLELICDHCGKQFDRLSVLELHKYVHMDRSEWPLECSICHKRFIAKGSFNRHLLAEHSQSDSTKNILRPEKCVICGRIYKSLEFLQKHIHEKHEKCFKCDKCNNVFKSDRERKRHRVIAHEERKFSCNVCGKMFHFKGGLRSHSKIHLPVRPFPCDICDKRFVDACELRRHMTSHTNEKPYVCEVCGQRFRLRYRLNIHMRGHTGERPYACSKCGAMFTNGNSLRIHKLTHADEHSYECAYCSMLFETPLKLYNHIKIHKNAFKCDICSRYFTSQFHVEWHKNKHHGERSCDKCGMKFKSLDDKKSHENTCGEVNVNGEQVINENESFIVVYEEN